MMTLKKKLKHRFFGLRGSFSYFGVRTYFPAQSGSFRDACEQGIYEFDNVQVLRALARPGTTCFDIGANIGLMALPILTTQPTCRVVSCEPSPNTVPSLRRTIAQSPFADRWELVEKALGAQAGSADFVVTREAGGVYDGFKDTGRVASDAVTVEISTLDTEWERLGRPVVSLVKIDVEGAELDVLAGARECLRTWRPDILLEWNETNFAPYGRKPGELLACAAGLGYRVFTVPNFVRVDDALMLSVQMIGTESFLLKPDPAAS